MENLQEAGALLGDLKQEEEARTKEKVRRNEEMVRETKQRGSADFEQKQEERSLKIRKYNIENTEIKDKKTHQHDFWQLWLLHRSNIF